MAMEIEGRIARKFSVQSGTSARGAWFKQEFLVEYQEGNYPTQVCMNVWGEDKVKELEKYQAGDKVKVSFNLSSREYNGRWYTDIRAWRIEPAVQQQSYPAAGYPSQEVPAPAQMDVPAPTIDDMPDDGDMPF